VDTSALVGAYLSDEVDHPNLRAQVLEGTETVVSSEVSRVEFGQAVRAAGRAGRLSKWQSVLARFDVDCQLDAPIRLLRLRSEVVLPRAYRLVVEHRLRTLDAIHLAVAIEERTGLADLDELAFVTRDADQATAARALGFEVR
jgi:uncharacterized protein